MIRRAQARCERFGDGISFQRGSALDLPASARFGGAVSRYVLHHVLDASDFIRQQVAHLDPGGVVVARHYTTDPDAALADAHQAIERARDRTHTRNLTPGALLDLFAAAGLASLELREEPFTLDFDEWFDRGTPTAPKSEVRAQVLAAASRGFTARETSGRRHDHPARRAYVRGVKP